MTLGGGAVAVLIPCLHRPHRASIVVDSLRASSPETRVVFIASPEDHAQHDAVTATGADLLVLDEPPGRGDYARKINAGIKQTSEPLLFMGADDLLFHNGWLPAALAQLAEGVGVVGTNDLHNRRVMRGDHATHLLFTRAYVETFGTIDEPGKLLHEGYPHEWCDDECVQTARARNAWAFAADSHVEHLHPNYGGRPADDLDAPHARRMRDGQRIFMRRRRLWT